MAIWKITNLEKKNAVERQFWTREGKTITREDGFRWGIWTCESESKPDINLDNPDGYQVGFGECDWEMEEMQDGCWSDITYPEDMTDEEQEAWQTAWDEDFFEGVEKLGWINDETEYWIYGPIQLTNEDTGETYDGQSN
jgi:hypothetical protein